MALTGDCGAPSMARFHGAHAVAIGGRRLPPEVLNASADGCAIVSFTLDEDGAVTDSVIEVEHPAGSGVKSAAAGFVVRNTYIPNSEIGFDTVAPAGEHVRYAITVGLGHTDGRLVFVQRAVVKHQTIRLGH